MISRTQRNFWHYFDKLPAAVQALAREKFRSWQREPFHPPLQFKPLIDNIWSVRIGNSYRALARRYDDLVVWFWIGTHEEYNNFVKQLR
ncbi:MAG: hypothetical protein ABIU29_05665 [Chthoniobacterales bacterium]